MDNPEQTVEGEFLARCHEFTKRLANTITPGTDNLGVTVNGSLHFAGFLLAQFIRAESANRPVDLQEEVSTAAGILANATAQHLNNLQAKQVGVAFAANDSNTKH